MTEQQSPRVPTSAAATPQRFRGRIRGLDGPRGIACMCVLAVHVTAHYSEDTASSAKLQLLGQALIFFFALSGFLLFLPIVRDLFLGKDAQPNVRAYAIHRALRIFPAYLVIFLITNFALQVSFVDNAQQTLVAGSEAGTGMITNPLSLLANLTLVQTYFPSLIQTGINPAWSLTLEIAFYISLPIIGAVLFWLRRTRGWSPLALTMAAPIALVVLGSIGKVFASWLQSREGITDVVEANFGPNWSAVVLRSFLGGSDAFAFGMAAVVVFVAVGTGVIGSKAARRIRFWSVIALFPSLVLMLAFLVKGSAFQSTFTSLASGLIILIIVLPLAEGGESKMADALDFKPFEYLGRISLSIYLWHFPMLMALGKWGLMAGDDWAGLVRNFVLLSVVSIALGSITYRWVEKPGLMYARKFKSK
ncbi:acyltransferase family protein [Williamsia maris]|nr:acyltransferase [Williamsia maris]